MPITGMSGEVLHLRSATRLQQTNAEDVGVTRVEAR